MLHHIIEIILPSIISILELMGILIVVWSAVHSFWECIQNAFMHKHRHIQSDLAKGLATGLEFKLGAEILKTVLIQSLDELYVLGAVILLRSLMSLLIHFEMKHAEHEEAKADEAALENERAIAEKKTENV